MPANPCPCGLPLQASLSVTPSSRPSSQITRSHAHLCLSLDGITHDQVLDALDLGRATLDKIKANLAWALGYNVIGIPLAAG